jgi:hypothetical protein
MMTHMTRWVRLSQIKKVFVVAGLEVPQSYVDDDGAYAGNIRDHVTARRGARAGETFALMCAERDEEQLDYHNPDDPDL